jgi:CheY-like chemotaxis protein
MIKLVDHDILTFELLSKATFLDSPEFYWEYLKKCHLTVIERQVFKPAEWEESPFVQASSSSMKIPLDQDFYIAQQRNVMNEIPLTKKASTVSEPAPPEILNLKAKAFPLLVEAAAYIKLYSNDIQDAIKKSNHILIADDDAFNLNIMNKFLAKEGYTVHEARNGKEAVALAQQHLAEIKLVLMDAEMPECDGPTATQAILHLLKDAQKDLIPVIGITGNVAHSEIQKCYASGMKYVFSKPANFEEICKLILKEMASNFPLDDAHGTRMK